MEIRKVVAVSLNCMGRSRMSAPLRVILDNERRFTWPINETSKATTLR